MLDLYRAQPIEGYNWLHGVRDGRLVHIGGVDAPISDGDVRAIVKEFWKAAVRRAATASTSSAGTSPSRSTRSTSRSRRRTASTSASRASRARCWRKGRRAGRHQILRAGRAQRAGQPARIGDGQAPRSMPTAATPPSRSPISSRPIATCPTRSSPKSPAGRSGSTTGRWTGTTRATPSTTWPRPTAPAKTHTCRLSLAHTYERPGAYTVVVKVIDILGNDTTKTLAITVG